MKNNKRNRTRPVLFHYRCESCNNRFSLPTPKASKDPYPYQKETPFDENMILCLICRKEQDNAFEITLEDI